MAWAANQTGLDCLPWYFPPLSALPAPLCDPWDTRAFMAAVRRAPRSACPHCLSDCQATTFSLAASSAPLRRCTSLNSGLSRLCQLMPGLSPALGSQQILAQYAHLPARPAYLDRFTGSGSPARTTQAGNMYDAYEKVRLGPVKTVT